MDKTGGHAHMSTHGTRIRVLGSMLAITTTSASAAQFDYGWRVDVGRSDNIGLTETNPISQTVLVPGFDFSYQQQGATFQANVVGNLEYRDYLAHAFDSQKLAQLAGQANWTVLPQRLDFAVRDVASVQPLSTFSSNTPNNQQQTNVLALGPTLLFRLNDTLHGQTTLSFTNSRASRTHEFNSSRGALALRLIKDLTPTTELSGNAETERVTFDHGNGNPAYNRMQVFVSSLSHFSQFDVNASVGWSRLELSHASTVTSPLVRLDLDWRMTPSNSFALRAARQYGDAAEDLIAQLDQGSDMSAFSKGPQPSNIETGNAVISSQVYLARRLEAIYTYGGERLTARVAPLYQELTYIKDPTNNRRGRGGSAGLDYKLRPRTTVSITGNTESLHYLSLARTDRTTNFAVALTDQRTAHWSWNVSFTRRLRRSDFAGASYHANEIYLGVAYRR